MQGFYHSLPWALTSKIFYVSLLITLNVMWTELVILYKKNLGTVLIRSVNIHGHLSSEFLLSHQLSTKEKHF